MTINKAIGIGVAGNEVSRQITEAYDMSTGRTAVPTAVNILGWLGSVEMCTLNPYAFRFASPEVVPIGVADAVVSSVASLFDW